MNFFPWVQFFSGPAGLKTSENPRFRPTHPLPSPQKTRCKHLPTHTLARGRQLRLAVGADPPAAGAAQRDLCTKGPSSGAKSPISGYALGMHGMYSISPICLPTSCKRADMPQQRASPATVAPPRPGCAVLKNPRTGPTHPPPTGRKTREQDPPTHPLAGKTKFLITCVR